MKVLLDECLDWRLLRQIADHEVKTARQMAWSTIDYGKLLAAILTAKRGIATYVPA